MDKIYWFVGLVIILILLFLEPIFIQWKCDSCEDDSDGVCDEAKKHEFSVFYYVIISSIVLTTITLPLDENSWWTKLNSLFSPLLVLGSGLWAARKIFWLSEEDDHHKGSMWWSMLFVYIFFCILLFVSSFYLPTSTIAVTIIAGIIYTISMYLSMCSDPGIECEKEEAQDPDVCKNAGKICQDNPGQSTEECGHCQIEGDTTLKKCPEKQIKNEDNELDKCQNVSKESWDECRKKPCYGYDEVDDNYHICVDKDEPSAWDYKGAYSTKGEECYRDDTKGTCKKTGGTWISGMSSCYWVSPYPTNINDPPSDINKCIYDLTKCGDCNTFEATNRFNECCPVHDWEKFLDETSLELIQGRIGGKEGVITTALLAAEYNIRRASSAEFYRRDEMKKRLSE